MPLTSSIFSKVLALSKNSTGFMMYYILSLKCIIQTIITSLLELEGKIHNTIYILFVWFIWCSGTLGQCSENPKVYINSLVKAHSFYVNSTNTTFQKELNADSFTYTYIKCLPTNFSHWSNATLIPVKSWRPLDNSRRWEMMKEFKILAKNRI